MKRTNLLVALSALTVTVAGIFSFKPSQKSPLPFCVYAAGYGYLFGGTPLIPWTNTSGHTAFFKTVTGPLVTLMTGTALFLGKAYVH